MNTTFLPAEPAAAGLRRGPFRSAEAGLTLVELLISLALSVVLLLMVVTILASTGRGAQVTAARTDVQTDGPLAAEFVRLRFERACAVVPSGSSLLLPAVPGTAVSGSRTWTVGPRMAAVITSQGAAMEWNVFYLLPRSEYQSQVTAEPLPPGMGLSSGQDTVLMMLRVPATSCAVGGSIPSAGAEARLVSAGVLPPTASEPRFVTAGSGTAASVSYALRWGGTVRGRDFAWPSASSAALGVTVLPRNY